MARFLCRAPTDAGRHCCRRRSARPARRSSYRGKYRAAAHCPDAGEDFFPTFGAAGSWLSFSAAPIRDADGIVIGCIETLQDITERKVAENARRESERRLIDIVARKSGRHLRPRCGLQGHALESRLRETLTGLPRRRCWEH
ncbi:MAG: PAS domain-containing protein [Sulfuritalea sp.]|nr:PAS domain-containing protein [Sulfuritalea sp.]